MSMLQARRPRCRGLHDAGTAAGRNDAVSGFVARPTRAEDGPSRGATPPHACGGPGCALHVTLFHCPDRMPVHGVPQSIEAARPAPRRGIMTRVLSLALIALAIVGGAVSGASAQPAAPTPQVTITGFIDTVSSWSKNLNDSLATRTGEREWYARNRGRFDIIGQLGTAKAVFGFEIDHTFGTTAVGGQDNNLAAGGAGSGQHNGTTGAFDLNTDTQG